MGCASSSSSTPASTSNNNNKKTTSAAATSADNTKASNKANKNSNMTDPSSYQKWIDRFQMQPHPEGGFYAETYRSELTVQTSKGERSASTAIYFLMTPGSVSRFHRLTLSDEVWHYYGGGTLHVVELVQDGEQVKVTKLGLGEDCVPQYTVKANTWFGSYPDEDYSLVGCTVAPGFDFADFELASRAKLLEEFPKAPKDVIEKLTKGLP